MKNIYDCVESFKKLLNVEYLFVLGHKGKLYELKISFLKSHLYHLMGFQYLEDLRQIHLDREKIFDKIESRKITKEYIESSSFYSKIEKRIDFLPNLESIFDSNDTIFKYNSKENRFSVIKAEYLLENTIEETKTFVFLDKSSDSNYFCRSFFPIDKTDYSKGQMKWTLVFKKKINTETNEENVLYDKLKK